MKEEGIMPSNLYNNEAEQYMLAAILRNPKEYFSINDVGLVDGDFVNKDHRAIFKAVLSAVDERSDPTLPYIVEYLKSSGKDAVVDYVSGLMTVPCSVSEAHDLAKTVKGLSVSRNLGEAGARIIDISQERRSDYSSAIVDAEEVLRGITASLPAQERSPVVSDILRRMDSVQHEDKIPINFSYTMQSLTGGLSRGHFWVIGAFSTTGKSAFAANLALDAARHKNSNVAIVSAEMTQEQYLIRMMAIESGVSQLDISSRVTIGLDKQRELLKARKSLEGYNLFVYDDLYRMSQIRTEMTRLKNQQGLDVMFLDYIQNVTVTGDEVSDAREIALECQRLAKDLDCSVVALSQVSNAQARYEIVEGGDDNYYSLKGHGAIRDAADVVLTLHRDTVRNSSALQIKWRKNRHGPTSNFKCYFDLVTGRIEEMRMEEDDED
jgi:replicative DNA helicase